MSVSIGGRKMGRKRPIKKSKSASAKSKKRRPEASPRGVIEITDALLMEELKIPSAHGETMRMTALEAILRQILSKELSGNARALRVRLLYQSEFGPPDGGRAFQIVHEDNEHMRRFAQGPQSERSESSD